MRSFLRAEVWLMLFGLTAVLPAQNWIQWKSAEGGNGHYFALTLAETNWEAAQRLADAWGGHLATITSGAEQQFINSNFLTGALDKRPVWIGLVDTMAKRKPWKLKLGSVKIEVGNQPKPKYAWVTGEAINYENWHPNQPDNAGGDEHYVAINWFYSDSPSRGLKGDWNDAPLDGTRGYSGGTDGPYFGLVERDYDPQLPVRRAARLLSPMNFLLGILAAGCGMIIYARYRRGKKVAASVGASKSDAEGLL